MDPVGEDGELGSPCGREATKHQKKHKRKPIETESITSRAMAIGTMEEMRLRKSKDVTSLGLLSLRIPMMSRIRSRIAAMKAAELDEKRRIARLSPASELVKASDRRRNAQVKTSHGEKEYE